MKWLFLVHQLQTSRSRERVKIWRLTKRVGAVLYRNSVYVLPCNKERLEDFQWLCQQIKDSKGEASIFVSESHNEEEDRTIRMLFAHSREENFTAILGSAEKLRERIRIAKEQQRLSTTLLQTLAKEAKQLDESLNEVERIDFFPTSSAKKVRRVLDKINYQISSAEPRRESPGLTKRYSRKEFQEKVWATRENIHIDRASSAWLIRRFIDPQAKFVFARESKLPAGAILFDVFGAEFSHHGEDCTFETLLKAFRIRDKVLVVIGEIVHDIDMKDQKFGRPEAAGLDIVIRSLSNSLKDDHKVLEVCLTIFDGLYAHLATTKQQKRR